MRAGRFLLWNSASRLDDTSAPRSSARSPSRSQSISPHWLFLSILLVSYSYWRGLHILFPVISAASWIFPSWSSLELHLVHATLLSMSTYMLLSLNFILHPHHRSWF
ncbi:uncharacterized protein F5147DRAFT_686871, partial [Suillus discolor]